MKIKKLTLIELIIVISILGILSLIVIPNIKDFNYDAEATFYSFNVKNIQTAVDIYRINTRESFPSTDIPNEGYPVKIDFKKLMPKYLNKSPNKGYYWVDVFGQVWASEIDSPNNLSKEGTSLQWTNVGGAKEYIIYEMINSTQNSSNKIKINKIGNTKNNSFNILDKGTSRFAISSVDRFGNISAPVGEKNIYNYTGIGPETDTQKYIEPMPKLKTDIKLNESLIAPEEGWQRIEETSPYFIYTGAWSYYTDINSGASGNSFIYSENAINLNPIKFKFLGTGLRIIGVDNANHSDSIKILIDGQEYFFSQKTDSPVIQPLQFEKIGLKNEIHEIEIVSTSGLGVRFDAIDIDTAGRMVASIGQQLSTPETTWQRYSSLDYNISYRGYHWAFNDNVNFYNGGVQYNDDYLNSSFDFKFEGTKLRIIGANHAMHSSSIQVTIDGKNYYFSQANTEPIVFNPLHFEIVNLNRGVHTVSVKSLNNLGPRLTAIDIDSDGKLLPSDNHDAWKTIDDTDSRITYNGAGWKDLSADWLYNNSFKYNDSAVNQNPVTFNFSGTKLRIIGASHPAHSSNVRITIDGTDYYFSQTDPAPAQNTDFEIRNLSTGVHSVSIVATNNLGLRLDAIQVDYNEDLK